MPTSRAVEIGAAHVALRVQMALDGYRPLPLACQDIVDAAAVNGMSCSACGHVGLELLLFASAHGEKAARTLCPSCGAVKVF